MPLCLGMVAVMLVGPGADSKVYYDYNYRVVPGSISRQQQEAPASPAWLLPHLGDSETGAVIDYYDPEEEFGER